MAEFERFSPPVSSALHSTLAVVFTIIGFSLMAYFFAVRAATKSSSVAQEMVIAILSSMFMGIGVLFTFLTVGLWV
ncbi:Transmembrane protein 258-like protein [Diplonema papillatum]|nr:Transmembrane protein 258-like protein [Diplonema papillatum]